MTLALLRACVFTVSYLYACKTWTTEDIRSCWTP